MQGQKKGKPLIVDPRFASQIEKFITSTYTMQNFNELLQSLISDDIIKQHQGLIGIRKILSDPKDPPIQQVINAGLVPKMIEYVKQTEYPQLQLQGTWALSNIAAGTPNQCSIIVESGGIPLFIELLKNQQLGIAQQAIWAIGNIASGSATYRDNIIQNGGISNLVSFIQKKLQKNDYILKMATWGLSNLCRDHPLPEYQKIKSAILLLCHIVANDYISDKQIIGDACWAISHHINKKLGNIDILITTRLIPKLVSYITDDYLSLVVPCLRILGHVATGTEIQTNQILNSNGINQLYQILNHNNRLVRRQACWVISNITAGSKEQIQQVLGNSHLIQRILELFQQDLDDVKREICYIFSNVAHSGEPQKVYEFYKSTSILSYYCNLLMSYQQKTLQVSLDCLYIVLGVGEKVKENEQNPLVVEMLGLNPMPILEKLSSVDQESVSNRAKKLIDTYFKEKDSVMLSQAFDKNLNLNQQKMDIEQ